MNKALMQKLGISRPEDRKGSLKTEKNLVNPFEISGAFLNYCVIQGWLKKEGSNYYSTIKGRKELKKYGINLK